MMKYMSGVTFTHNSVAYDIVYLCRYHARLYYASYMHLLALYVG